MIYNIFTDKQQFQHIKNRNSCIVLINYDTNSIINNITLGEIHCDNHILISDIYTTDIISNLDELKNNHSFNLIKTDEVKSFYEDKAKFLLKNNNKIICVRVWVYLLGDNSNLTLIPTTLILYWNIQCLRHLPIEKRFFKYSITDDTKFEYYEIVKTIKNTIEFLKGNLDYSKYFELLKIVKQKYSFEWNDNLELLERYHKVSNLNDFRLKHLNEIENSINQIEICYQNKKYKQIQNIAYNIHNVPEMIRTLNDWRNT